jgi:hypothetical protein
MKIDSRIMQYRNILKPTEARGYCRLKAIWDKSMPMSAKAAMASIANT